MKTILITGAGGNLGTAAVERFATEGFRVIGLVSTGKIPDEKKPNVEYIEADLLQEGPVEAIIDQLSTKYPTIDAALLTVGGFEAGDITATDEAAMKRMHSLNFVTAYNVARPLFRRMQLQANGGHIVFIGAKPVLDAKTGKNLMAYGLSKSLLFKLAEYLTAASERVKPHVIVFNTLDTPQNRKSMPKADTSKWVKTENVAEVMVDLAGGKELGIVIEIEP